MYIDWNKRLYHGSNAIVKKPDLSLSREDIDFGIGFYLTTDINMAKKWASSKAKSIVNTYSICTDNLNIYTFSLDKEWLEYIRACREYGDEIQEIKNRYNEYDILIGPTADDKLFDTVQQYLDGELSSETAVKYLNVAGYANQIVLKTQKAVDAITFVTSKELYGLEKQQIKQISRQDRRNALDLLNKIKKEEVLQKSNGGIMHE